MAAPQFPGNSGNSPGYSAGQDRENRLNARLSGAEAKCGTPGPSGPSGAAESIGNTGTTVG